MGFSVRRALVVSGALLLFLMSFGTSVWAQPAVPTGVYDILQFPGAPGTCDAWAVYSTNGVIQPGPSNYVETMTDGLGNVVFSRTSTGSIGTFTFWGSGTFTTPPQANPIHEHIVMDGVVIADIYADSPCFAPRPVPALSSVMLLVLGALFAVSSIYVLRRRRQS